MAVDAVKSVVSYPLQLDFFLSVRSVKNLDRFQPIEYNLTPNKAFIFNIGCGEGNSDISYILLYVWKTIPNSRTQRAEQGTVNAYLSSITPH